MPEFRAVLTQVRRAVARYRRALGALLAAGAVVAVVDSLAPAAPATRDVVVAAHDLASGTRLAPPDLRVVAMPPSVVPAGTSESTGMLVGRVVAGPVRTGEALTDLRLLGGGLLARYRPGLVAVPVPLTDAAIAGLLHVGDHIDVFAATSDSTAAALVVADAPVLALVSAGDSDQGGLVVVGVSVRAAADLAAASATAPLTVALLR